MQKPGFSSKPGFQSIFLSAASGFRLVCIVGLIARARLEVCGVGRDIGSQVNDFAGRKLFDGIEHNFDAMIVGAFIVARETNAGDILSTFGGVGRRHIVNRENGIIRAGWYASAAVNTGIGVNVVPGMVTLRNARHDTVYRTNLHTSAIAQAQTGDYVSHKGSPFLK
jgi:hypothetical protein